MFEIPGTNVASVHITEDYVKGVTKQPVYVHKEAESTTNSLNTEDDNDKNPIRIQQSA